MCRRALQAQYIDSVKQVHKSVKQVHKSVKQAKAKTHCSPLLLLHNSKNGAALIGAFYQSLHSAPP